MPRLALRPDQHGRALAEMLVMAELRIPNAAAQTRIVSGGEFWPIERELSRHLKYIARVRIPEFESYHPSHAVQSLRYESRGSRTVLGEPGGESPPGHSSRMNSAH
jgi:hypothetical protein